MSKRQVYTKAFTDIFTFTEEMPEHISNQQLFVQSLANTFHFDTHQHVLDITCHLLKEGYIGNFGLHQSQWMYGYLEHLGMEVGKTPLSEIVAVIEGLPAKYKAGNLDEWVSRYLGYAERDEEECDPPDYDNEFTPVFFYGMAPILKPFEIKVSKAVKGDVETGTRWSDDARVLVLNNPNFLSSVNTDLDCWDLY